MKYCLIIACIFGCMLATLAQVPVKPYVPVTLESSLNPSGTNRGTSQLEINYHVYESQLWQWNPGAFSYLLWPVNKAYNVTTTPYNNTDGYSIRWGAVVFDTIRDITHNQGIPYASVNSLTVDSVVLLFNHVNHSGQPNRLILSIYSANAGASKVTYTNGTNMEFANTLLWRDTIVTTTSLTPTAGNVAYRGVFATGGVNVPGQNGYVVRLDYEGPKSDTLNIADGNPMPCGPTEGSEVAYIEDNTVRYFVGLSSNTPPVADFSGIDPLSVNTTSGCDLFFFQNLGISTVVTADRDMTVQATGQTTACSGARSFLSATVSSTSGRYSVLWTGPGAIDFPDSTQSWVSMPTAAGSYMYVVTATDSVTGEVARDTIIKQVSFFDVDLGNDTVVGCQSSINFSPVFSGDTVGKTFTYYTVPGGGIVNSMGGPGMYRIMARNGAGCRAYDTIVVGTATGQAVDFTIASFHNQDLSDTIFLTQGDTICQGVKVLFRNTSAKINGWNFEWGFSGATVVPTSPDTISRVFSNTGTQTIRLTADSANCTIVKYYNIYVAPYNQSPCFNFAACPAPSTGNMGYIPVANSLPCVVQGVPYQETIHFELPTRINNYTIGAVFIDSIVGLPCGITYSLDRNHGYRYQAGESGCITLSGTTTDAPGKYKLRMYIYYNAGFITWRNGPLDSLVGASFTYDIRVKDTPAAACASTSNLTEQNRSCPNEVPLFVTIDRRSPYIVCDGDEKYLSAEGGGGKSNGNYTYSWLPANSLSCSNCRTPIATPTQTTTYTVTATDGFTTATDTFTLEVATADVVSVTIMNNSPVFCYNQPNALDVQVSGVHSSLPYTVWFFVNGQQHSVANEGINNIVSSTFNPGDEVQVGVVVSLQGCQFVKKSNYVVVSSCLNSTLDLTLSSDTTVCPGANTALQAVASGGTGNYTYRWLPNSGLSCYNCPNPVATVQNTTIYTCVVNDGANTISKNTTVSVADVLVDAGADANTCNGGVQLLATTAAANTLSWSPAMGLSCTNCPNPIANPTATTVYYVEATGPASLGSCKATDSVTVYVPVSTQASVTIATNPDEPCLRPGFVSTVTFEATGINGGNATYQWQHNGTDVPATLGGNNPVISLPLPSNGDLITCIMRSSLPCISQPVVVSNTIVIDHCVGIDEIGGKAMEVVLSPNPTSGLLYIDAKINGATSVWVINVFDLSGKKLLGQTVGEATLSHHAINLGSMAQGTYLLQISNGAVSRFERIVVF